MSLSHILAECARLAAGGGAGALASVARRRGSLPMSGTAKMLVTAGGARTGTVGGGCLEAEITERALDVIERRQPAVSEHTLNSELAGDYGLTCGGTAVMLIEPVFPDALLAAVYEETAALLARGGRGVLVTGADWSHGPAKLLVAGDRRIGAEVPALLEAAARYEATGRYDAAARHDAASGFDHAEASSSRLSPRSAARELPELADGILAERVAGAPRLIVFGGGHVGARVGEAATFAGWRVTVVDDRPDFADPVRHAFAERTVVCDFADLPSTLAIEPETYVVVCTRGHQHDATIVDQIGRIDTRYVGMLGSRRKVALTWALLERAGVPRERLERIHAPVGIAIGADTPEEIAISVVAEMIAVRRRGTTRRGGIDVDAVESFASSPTRSDS